MNNSFKWKPWTPGQQINKVLTSIPRSFGWLASPLGIQTPGIGSLYTSPFADGQEVPNVPGAMADPGKHTILYNDAGKRMVFYHGSWIKDDPQDNNFWEFVGRDFGFKTSGRVFDYVDEQGNYLDYQTGNVIPPGTWQWLTARWGDNVPESVIETFEAEDSGDATFDEEEHLNYLNEQAINYTSPGLVKLGKPPVKPGDTFYINGQRAIMGRPDAEGKMQYAVTEAGSGDRWKYKTVQDADGNWTKVYYRSWGAVKERQMRLEAKGKDDDE